MKGKALAIGICFLFFCCSDFINGQENWDKELRDNLKAVNTFRKQGEKENEASALNLIAGIYFREGIFQKAAQYYEQEFSLCNNEKYNKLALSSEMAGKSYYNLKSDSLSSIWYEKAVSYYETADDAGSALRCREMLCQVYTRLGNYESAYKAYNELAEIYARNNDFKNLASIYNLIGFLQFRKEDTEGALASFTRAIEFSEKGGRDDFFLTDAWSNKAICLQNLSMETEMLSSFMKALEYANNSGRIDEAARIQRIMAAIYFKRGDNYHAELYCLDCIRSAKASGNFDVLQLCYWDYSAVLEKGNDFINANEYYKKYLNLRDSLIVESRLKEKELEARIARYEALEQRIKDEIATEEIQSLIIKNLRADSLDRENKISLLIQQQELENLENVRLLDSLALESGKLELNRKEQDINLLRWQQKSDSLTIRQQESEANLLKTENQLLEDQKKQEAERAQKARQIRNMAIGLGVLMGLVAVMILFGLISSRRKNQKLAESKLQIEKINADLEQKNEEVIRQKDIIEQKNQSITDSIQYASRIQTAVLPPENFLNEWGFENFILFKPKDIVSGDFYWGVKKNEKAIIAAADCTGHGVPGAFMSMLGHAFLEEIVNTREIENAASILNILRDEIINTLRQKGTTGEARDGMDISLIILDLKEGKLDYAGANNPLYLIRDGKLTKYLADRMPIGIHFISLTPFTNQTIELRKGDYLYMFSDGYADQFGGPKGKKFMYKPFQDMVLRNHTKPMETQKEILNTTFEKWKGDREQVDDVMVIGIRL
jgi:serine phosphatase RsbU (regulator of sigma subunit)/TPR repeat protein